MYILFDIKRDNKDYITLETILVIFLPVIFSNDSIRESPLHYHFRNRISLTKVEKNWISNGRHSSFPWFMASTILCLHTRNELPYRFARESTGATFSGGVTIDQFSIKRNFVKSKLRLVVVSEIARAEICISIERFLPGLPCNRADKKRGIIAQPASPVKVKPWNRGVGRSPFLEKLAA